MSQSRFSKKGLVAAAIAASPVSARILYASSYAGTVTTLDLDESAGTLKSISSNSECGGSPSWLTLDGYGNNALYCVDEAWSTPETGHLTSYTTSADGTLTKVSQTDIIGGPVKAAQFGADGSGLAIAGYGAGAASVVTVTPSLDVSQTWSKTYTMSSPGPVADRQDKPYIHDAVLDPKGQFVVMQDLGADLLRLYKVESDGQTLTDMDSNVATNPGAGPRHGAFASVGDKTYYYVITELDNTLNGWEVTYTDGGNPTFTSLFPSFGTHGQGNAVPSGAAGSEVAVSPDNKFLIAASRLEGSLTMPSFDNSTQIKSDPIFAYSIDQTDGSLSLVGEYPAGGMNPRHFAISPEGDLVVASLQEDERVVVISRDTVSGELGDFVANIEGMGQVNCAIFG